ncbi:hypothetical protein QE152_g29224 [Popillia japonica]|uniref:Uncharacterized protein n=1 Tax=Popillia japonica TaxID=7064 RepID=A0AAW1JHL7_POPJA
MDGDTGTDLTVVVSGKGAEVACLFIPPIYLNGQHEMCMISLQTYNSIPNVTSYNNAFRYYSHKKPHPDWVNVIIPDGTYDIHDLVVEMYTTVDVDFSDEASIGSLLGFQRTIYLKDDMHISENIVDINRTSAIDIMCNIVDGSYRNGEPSHILYHFYPNAEWGTVPPRFKIIEVPEPSHILYHFYPNVPPGFKIIEVPDDKIYMF